MDESPRKRMPAAGQSIAMCLQGCVLDLLEDATQDLKMGGLLQRSEKGTDMGPVYQGAISGLLVHMARAGCSDEQIGLLLETAHNDLLPQVRLGLAAEAAGGSATEQGTA